MKHLLVLGGARVFQIVLALFSLKMTTWFLSIEELGNLFILNSFNAFFGLLFINPPGQYISRKFVTWSKKGTQHRNLKYYIIYILAISIISVPVAIFANRFGVGGRINNAHFALAIFLSICFGTWNNTYIFCLNLLENRYWFAILTSLTSFASLIGSICMILFWQESGVSWFVGQTLGFAGLTMISVSVLRNVSPVSTSTSLVGFAPLLKGCLSVWKFSSPMGLAAIFIWTQNAGYRFILEHSMGLKYLGLIGLGLGIAANISGAFEAVILQYLLPEFYKKAQTSKMEERKQIMNDFLRKSIPAYFSLSILITILSVPLGQILIADKMQACSSFIMYGAWLEFFRMVTGVLGCAAQSEMQTTPLIRPYFIGGLLALSGVAFFSAVLPEVIPVWLVATGGLVAFLMFFDMRKLLAFSLPYRLLGKTCAWMSPVLLAVPLQSNMAGLPAALLLLSVFGLYWLWALGKILRYV